jgi:hypothetical protein
MGWIVKVIPNQERYDIKGNTEEKDGFKGDIPTSFMGEGVTLGYHPL